MSSIVLFDGVCNFCNGAVNFIINHDKANRFKFAPLQSGIGEEMKKKYGIADDIDSVILVEDGRAFTHSTAGLKIAQGLGGLWSLAYAFIIIPRPVRDLIYKTFATYRYRLFGKKDVCMMPTPAVRGRFLSDKI